MKQDTFWCVCEAKYFRIFDLKRDVCARSGMHFFVSVCEAGCLSGCVYV